MVDKTQTQEELLTAAAVGKVLSLSRRAVFRLRASASICAPIRVGAGAIRWRSSDIQAWISMGCCSQKEFEVRQKAASDR